MEDLRSEAWVCIFTLPDKATRAFASEDPEKEVGKLIFGWLEAFARCEKAERSGYEPDDEFYYTVPMLRELLPEMYDRDDWATAPKSEVHGRNTDPAEGGGMMAVKADIQRAMDSLSSRELVFLALRFRDGMIYQDIADHFEITEHGAEMAVNRALGRLRRTLGGSRPDYGREYIGTRRVISNAAAIARTHGQD